MYARVITPSSPDYFESLEELSLTPKHLLEIGSRALSAYNQGTDNDAKVAPGTRAYLEAIKAKRDLLCPEGWDKKCENGIELTVNQKSGISLIVSSGDKNVAVYERFPKTKNKKGRETVSIVLENNRQHFLPDFEPKISNVVKGKTWVLLYHFDVKNRQLRLELSLPVEMDMDNLRVTGWDKRIILPPIDFSSGVLPPDEGEDKPVKHDVTVRRKPSK